MYLIISVIVISVDFWQASMVSILSSLSILRSEVLSDLITCAIDAISSFIVSNCSSYGGLVGASSTIVVEACLLGVFS